MKLFLLCWLTFSITGTLWAASATVAWDPSPSIDVTGYKLYVGTASKTYTKIFDVGSPLQFRTTNLVPTIPYFYAVTAYNSIGLESDFSQEISYIPPLPATTLELNPLGVLTAHLFKGGTFAIQQSQNLISWSLFQTVKPASDTYALTIHFGLNDKNFFRVKFLSAKALPIGGAQAAVIRQADHGIVPPAPPLPPMNLRVPFRVKLKMFFHYRPGHHIDERKGAEMLMAEGPHPFIVIDSNQSF